MNKDEMRIAIAEACGQSTAYICESCSVVPEDRIMDGMTCPWCHGYVAMECPDYPNDLNAMAEAKRQLLPTPELCDTFNRMLMEEKPSRPVEFETDKWTWGQSAEVEARALLRTLNLYQDTRES